MEVHSSEYNPTDKPVVERISGHLGTNPPLPHLGMITYNRSPACPWKYVQFYFWTNLNIRNILCLFYAGMFKLYYLGCFKRGYAFVIGPWALEICFLCLFSTSFSNDAWMEERKNLYHNILMRSNSPGDRLFLQAISCLTVRACQPHTTYPSWSTKVIRCEKRTWSALMTPTYMFQHQETVSPNCACASLHRVSETGLEWLMAGFEISSSYQI